MSLHVWFAHACSNMHWSPSSLCITKLFAGSPGVTYGIEPSSPDIGPTRSA
ncbi:MAG TPA: hypothetical protein VIV58_30955 [Kofleriaceae bacterium]